MSSQPFAQARPRGLEALIRSAFQQLQVEAFRRAVRFRCDVPPDCPLPDASSELAAALEALLQRGLEQAREGDEIRVTAVPVGGCLEIEVADESTSCDREQRLRWRQGGGDAAFEKALANLRAAGCSVRAYPCAGGGVAFTLFLPRQAVRAAA